MTTEIFTTGLLLSGFGYLGYTLREVPKLIWNFTKRKIIFKVTINQGEQMYDLLNEWFTAHHTDNFSNISIGLEMNSDGKWKSKYHHHADTFFLKRNSKRLLVEKSIKEKSHGDLLIGVFSTYEISGYSAKEEVLKLIEEIIAWNNNKSNEGIVKIKTAYWNNWDVQNTVKPKGFESIFVDRKQELIDDIEKFLSQEDWYLERNIPYKRGYFISGEPGNGKSALLQAIALTYNKSLNFLSLKDVTSDRDIIQKYSNLNSGDILVLEDVDTFGKELNSREEKNGPVLSEAPSSGGKMSLSALLNCLDGVFSKHGVIVIATTNHPEKLDEAFLRDGRFDFKMHITNPSKNNVESYLSNFYQFPITLNDYKDGSLSMSAIQNLCLKSETIAECVWNIKHLSKKSCVKESLEN